MAKGLKKVKEVRLEDILWECRDHLRGTVGIAEKRDLLLTLVFLKFISDRYEEQVASVMASANGDEALAAILLKKSASFEKDGVIALPENCRWKNLVLVDSTKMALAFDEAIDILEKQEKKLKNALPQGIFVAANLEARTLKALVNSISKIDPVRFKEKDLIGRVYEYFLQEFAIQAKDSKEEGEFYTPRSLVELIANLIEPYDGTIYDPCCGSGGMFVQCMKVVESKGGNTKAINVYGQEKEKATYRLAKMNLAVRGISYHLGDENASTFTKDQHPDLRVDYIMANPPFNLKKWRGSDELLKDPRWAGYGVPPESNANYAWILHMLSKLDPSKGVAGFLLANGALDDEDTLAIRRKLIENDKVEAIIVLPREMFYSTDISVTLWILNQNKKAQVRGGRKLRDRSGEILFVDLRTWNENIYEKKYVRFTDEQIAEAVKIYHDWQGEAGAKGTYAKSELYYAAKLPELAEKGYSLVPSRYIEFVDRDTELDYKTALKDAGKTAVELLTRQGENAAKLAAAFKALGVKL